MMALRRALTTTAAFGAEIRGAEKRLLQATRRLLVPRLAPSPADLASLDATERHLDELFCITVIGEFNCGKSTFVNALLGQEVCEDGVTPTTSAVNTIRYDATASATARTTTAPSWLKDAILVDTPGTNAIIAAHEQITEEIIPRSDLVFFVTCIDRPFSESERAFLAKIHDWRRKIVVVVNKVDLLDSRTKTQDLAKVMNFVRSNTQQLLQMAPPIFPVSGKAELMAKLGGRRAADTGFADLEQFIHRTLSDADKICLKLQNPLFVVERLLDKYEAILDAKLENVEREQNALDKGFEELERSAQLTRSAFQLQKARVDNVLLRLADRVDDFLADQLQLANLPQLLRSTALARAFERDVVSGFAGEVERLVAEAADWLNEENGARARSVAVTVAEHSAVKTFGDGRQLVDSAQIGARLSQGRQVMQSELRAQTQMALQRYDRAQVAKQLTDTVTAALALSIAFQVSALGAGAALASAASLDPTGLAGAGALAVVGLVVLPYKRRDLWRQLLAQVTGAQRHLQTVLAQHLELELRRAADLVAAALGPYARLVEVERAALQSARLELCGLRDDVAGLRRQVGDAASAPINSP